MKPDTTFSDNGSSYCSRASSSKTLTPLPATKSKFDPLRTPISVPTTILPTPKCPKELEESIASDVVHACCRLHEAMAVTTDGCSKLIYEWSGGLGRDAAASYAKIAMERKKAHAENTYEGLMPRRAVLLQTLLTVTEYRLAAVGTKAGMVMDARASAVQSGHLLPLSALEEDPKMDDEDAIKTKVTATTFSAYTRGAGTTTDVTNLIEAFDGMTALTYHLVDFRRLRDGSIAYRCFHSRACDLDNFKKRLTWIKSRTLSVSKAVSESDSDPVSTLRDIQALVRDVVRDTAYTTDQVILLLEATVHFAGKYRKSKTKSLKKSLKKSQRKARKQAQKQAQGPDTTTAWFGDCETTTNMDKEANTGGNLDTLDELDDLLKQAQAAIQQASTAFRIIDGRIMRSV